MNEWTRGRQDNKKINKYNKWSDRSIGSYERLIDRPTD